MSYLGNNYPGYQGAAPPARLWYGQQAPMPGFYNASVQQPTAFPLSQQLSRPLVSYPPQLGINSQQSLEARIIRARQENLLHKQRLGQFLLQQQQQQQKQPNARDMGGVKGSTDDISLSTNFRSVPQPNLMRPPPMNQANAPMIGGQMSKISSKASLPPADIPNEAPNTPNDVASRTMTPKSFVPPSNSLPPSAVYHKQIYDLIDNLSTKASDHNQRLEDFKKQAKESKIKESKKTKKENRERIEALLQQKDGNNNKDGETKEPVIRLPLWKHKLQGNRRPPKEQILKGKALFRVIAMSILGIISYPQVSIKRKKLQFYDHNKRKFAQTLQIILGTMEEWMVKVVQLPITSIVTVSMLDIISIILSNLMVIW